MQYFQTFALQSAVIQVSNDIGTNHHLQYHNQEDVLIFV